MANGPLDSSLVVSKVSSKGLEILPCEEDSSVASWTTSLVESEFKT